MFLCEKKIGVIIFFDGLKGLKKVWQVYSGKIVCEQDCFCRMVFWFLFDLGMMLIFEEEVWIFLLEVSEIFVDMGVEIFFLLWWQIVWDSNMMFKVKVFFLLWGEFFVGMNVLFDFNWRFVINGIELLEDEFNEFVVNNRCFVNICG